MRIVIYGAQGVALGAYHAIKVLFPDQKIECFLVTEMGNNAKILGGIPVMELEEFVNGMSQKDKDNVEVMICTPENVMGAIEKSLDEVGLYNHIRIDSIRWAEMQRNAFIKSGEFLPLAAYMVGCKKASIQVCKMIHVGDKKLSTNYKEPDYVSTLQVGAALSEIQIAALTDGTGDHISEKNGNYSELTGLYWMWKNMLSKNADTDKYFGVAHYRRSLELSEDDLLRLRENEIDVVLPYPMPYEPDIEAHHLRYLSESEWNAVLQALGELQPEYAEAFKDTLKQGYFYNYNIVLAKENVLNEYCSWLFPLLFRIEQINDSDGTKSPNRYIGYVGETLETLYFMHNKDKLRIAHTGCRFLA